MCSRCASLTRMGCNGPCVMLFAKDPAPIAATGRVMSEQAVCCGECGGPAQRVYEDLAERHFGGSGLWSIAYCERCDCYRLDPAPSSAEIRDSYRDYYTHDVSPGAGFEGWLKRLVPAVRLGYGDRVGAWERACGRILAAVPPLRTIGERSALWLEGRQRGRVLDVGCGSGEMMLRLADLGWEVAGVEFDDEAARLAADRTGAPVVASLDELDERAFDAVILDHVVEHLAAAETTLRSCRRVLQPGGRLALATPNPSSAARARFGAHWLHWDPPRHLALRGERGLRALASRAGFEVEQTFSCAGSAHFVWYASRLLEREGALPGIAVRGLSTTERLAGLRFWLEELARVARGEDCGEEWIVLARRPVES